MSGSHVSVTLSASYTDSPEGGDSFFIREFHNSILLSIYSTITVIIQSIQNTLKKMSNAISCIQTFYTAKELNFHSKMTKTKQKNKNNAQVISGFSHQLKLKDGAVPAIKKIAAVEKNSIKCLFCWQSACKCI